MLLIVSSAAPMLAHAQRDLASIDGFVKDYSSHINRAMFGFLRNAEFDGNSWFNESIWECGGCESRAAFQPLCARPFDTNNPVAPRRRWTDSAE
jgi:hypothetical protein